MLLALAPAALAGCAAPIGLRGEVEAQRATEGPTADELFNARFVRGYARLPTFEETNAFRDDLDERVRAYIARHPELANSPRASQFRFHRRVAVGMNRAEVELLAGKPDAVITREADMAAGAGQFWPLLKDRVKEMWAYPGGWRLYFRDDELVDLTVLGKPPL